VAAETGSYHRYAT